MSHLIKRFFSFNKEIVFGEIGALIFIPLFSLITSKFTSSSNIISISAVIGGMIGGAIFWLAIRIYDNYYGDDKSERESLNKLSLDIAYFAPAAFILGLIVYQPTLFFLSRHLLNIGDKVIYSVILSQAISFWCFLILMNVYRIILYKFFGKRI